MVERCIGNTDFAPQISKFDSLETLSKNNDTKKYYFFEIYSENKDQYLTWLEQNYSRDYFVTLSNAMEKFLPHIKKYELKNEGIDKVSVVYEIIKKSKLNMASVTKCFRNFFKFLEEFELIEEEFLVKWRAKIKIKEERSSNIDVYVPPSTRVFETIDKLKKHREIFSLIYQLFVSSGIRTTEMDYFCKNFNDKKGEIHNNIVAYPLMFRRGNKNSYYIFMPLKIWNLLIKNKSKLKKMKSEPIKCYIKRHNLLPLKYLRKYNFNMLIQEIHNETADFIQGRSPKSVSGNHYMNMKNTSLKEYDKILKEIEKHIY